MSDITAVYLQINGVDYELALDETERTNVLVNDQRALKLVQSSSGSETFYVVNPVVSDKRETLYVDAAGVVTAMLYGVTARERRKARILV